MIINLDIKVKTFSYFVIYFSLVFTNDIFILITRCISIILH
jgi:hypothetical protein